MSDNENDIHVEVDVPPPAEVEGTPDAPAVVVVTEAPAADPAPDGLLPVLLRIEERLTNLEHNQVQVAEVAVNAQISADAALMSDEIIAAEVAEVREEVAEALEEDQAPAEADEAPKKNHWLHR